MALLSITNRETGLQELLETTKLRRIVTDRELGGSIVYYKSNYTNRGIVYVTEDLATIFAQQDTALFDLGMVLVTDIRPVTPEQIILFSHNFDDKGVVDRRDENGNVIGSRIIQMGAMPDFDVEEVISVVYGYQKAGVNLGFINVTRKSDNEGLLVMDHRIKYIKQDIVTGDATINFDNGTEVVVNESIVALQAAQSA